MSSDLLSSGPNVHYRRQAGKPDSCLYSTISIMHEQLGLGRFLVIHPSDSEKAETLHYWAE